MKILSITKGGLELSRVQLKQPLFTIGRSPTCDVVLRAPGIRAVHFLLEWTGVGEFSKDTEAAGVWVLLDVASEQDGSKNPVEGVLLSAQKNKVHDLIFQLIEDRLEAKEDIGGRIVSELKSQPTQKNLEPVTTLELVYVRTDSGAIESIRYVSPFDLKWSRKQKVFRDIPEFRIKWVADQHSKRLVLDLERMEKAEVLSKGQIQEIHNHQVPIHSKDMLQIRWQDWEFFVRLVAPIHITPMPHEFLGDAETKKRYLQGLILGLFIFLAIGLFSGSSQPKDEDKNKRIVLVEVPAPKKIEADLKKDPGPKLNKNKEKVATPPPIKKPIPKAAPGAPPKAANKPPRLRTSPTPRRMPAPAPSKAQNQAANSAAKAAANARSLQVAQTKAAQAKAAESLSFLSGSAVTATKSIKVGHSSSGAPSLPSSLREQSKLRSNVEDSGGASGPVGPIQTKGSRSYSNDSALIGSAREGAGQIYGKVNLKGGGGQGLEGSIGAGGGLTISGSGSANSDAITKVIQKNARKFQYCYEKALLSDPDIGGVVNIAWGIGSSGRASNIRVKNSQIRNEGLMNCMKAEISKLQFPAPKGGSVDVEYPFSFSATRL